MNSARATEQPGVATGSGDYRAVLKTATRDVLIITVFAAAAFGLAASMDAMEAFTTWSAQHEAWNLDEILSLFIVASVGLTIFSMRRWRELRAFIAHRAAAELALRESEKRLEKIFSASPFPVLILSTDNIVLSCNAEFERATGHSAQSVIGQNSDSLALWASPDFHSVVQQKLRYDARIRNEEIEFKNKSGAVHQALFSATLIPYDGHVAILAALNDISDRRELEQRLEHQAFHDALTGLANRSLFHARLEHAMIRAQRSARHPVVLFLDLDDFKRVNDLHGHAVGDELLIAVSKRLMACLRSEDTCARLGGDEFAILVEDGSGSIDGIHLSERLVPALQAPYELSTLVARVGVSIGIAVADHEDDVEIVLRNADLAMYMSKTAGKGCFTLFEPSMHARVVDRLQLENDLQVAMERNEFSLAYQPIVSIASGDVLSIEALLRWQHPTRGALPPSEFIPMAEASGLIIELGRWVLEQACRETRQLHERYPLRAPISLAVNLSGRQIAHEDVVKHVSHALTSSGLPANQLTLEITESELVHNEPEVLERLWALKRLGCRIAIDDFGTGYSSLAYLQKFPVDILKIDKSFTDRLGTGADESPIARAVVALGNTISLQTVAEGIETPQQWERLRELGCECGQGFYFARPALISAIDALLDAEDGIAASATAEHSEVGA